MRSTLSSGLAALPLLAVCLAVPGYAARTPAHTAHAATAAKAIGRFEDWTAATHQEGGQTVCYIFTRATASAPAVAGRGDVVLTVTERAGAPRDAVALSAGFAYPPGAEVVLQVDGASLPFYTSQRSAFARDGHAVTGLFERGRSAAIRSSGPHEKAVIDSFSLRGFSSAYAAMTKACPAKT